MGTDDRRIVLTRKELYERVWSTPMRRLAGEFGLSDVSLAKICRRHKIPCPTRGYWAKRRNGKKTYRRRLPKIDDESLEQISMSVVDDPPKIPKGRPPLAVDPEIARLIQQEKDPINKIKCAKSLDGADPYVLTTETYLADAKEDEYGRLFRPGVFQKPYFVLCVSRKQASRSLLILHTLVQALLKRGHKLVISDKSAREIEVEILGHRYRLSMWESSSHYKRSATMEDRKRLAEDPWYGWRDYEYRPTGFLELCIDRSRYGSLAKIRETNKQKLEDRLNEVVIKLLRLVDKRQVAQERARIKQKESAARKKVAIEQEIANRMDEVRIAWIAETLPKWEAAQRLRPFVEAVRDVASKDEVGDAEGEVARWLSWATKYIKSLDPLSNSRDLPTYSLSQEQIEELRAQCDSDWCEYSESFHRSSTQVGSIWDAISIDR